MNQPSGPDRADTGASRFVLRLFVSGPTPRSLQAVANLKTLCERHLAGCYELEIIDIFQQPELAVEAHVQATPMLLRVAPQPARRLAGALENAAAVLDCIGLTYPSHGRP